MIQSKKGQNTYLLKSSCFQAKSVNNTATNNINFRLFESYQSKPINFQLKKI